MFFCLRKLCKYLNKNVRYDYSMLLCIDNYNNNDREGKIMKKILSILLIVALLFNLVQHPSVKAQLSPNITTYIMGGKSH